MSNFNRLTKKCKRKKEYNSRIKEMRGSPHKRGTCIKTLIVSPKKPNSANRKISRVLLRNGIKVSSYIKGIGHSLQEHSTVLVQPGRRRDIPGMRYTNVRGVYDFGPVEGRQSSRSKYGCKGKST